MAPVVTKTTCELYKLRGLPHMGWADISIDAAEEHGRISVSSDYGNFANFWSHCGGPFKPFLASLDIGYFAGKIGMNKWFDHDKTMKSLRSDVLGWRKEKTIDKDLAREFWDKLEELQYEGNEHAFCNIAYNCDPLWARYDACDFPLYYTIDPMFRNFWENCWPVFLKALEDENA